MLVVVVVVVIVLCCIWVLVCCARSSETYEGRTNAVRMGMRRSRASGMPPTAASVAGVVE